MTSSTAEIVKKLCAEETPAATSLVCEWRDLGHEWSSSCKVRFEAFASTKGRFFCPSCSKPIKFKEGSE
jgi:hypothetical protein